MRKTFFLAPLNKLHTDLSSRRFSSITSLVDEYQGKINTLNSRASLISYISQIASLSSRLVSTDHDADKSSSWLASCRFMTRQSMTIGLEILTRPKDLAHLLYSARGWVDLHEASRRITRSIEPKKVTLITSMFNSSKWMKTCLDNITSQTAFSQCEILLFDCERSELLLESCMDYLVQHENIRYLRLTHDPGLYGVWNLGILISDSCYIGNLNTDDLRSPMQLETLIQALDCDNTTSIASTAIIPYSETDLSKLASLGLRELDETSLFSSDEEAWYTYMAGPYGISQLFKKSESGISIESQCIPHCAPLWKRSLHKLYGYFNEDYYSSAADWGFWCTALAHGEKAVIVGRPYTYYYVNPSSYMRRDVHATQITQQMCDAHNSDRLKHFVALGTKTTLNIEPTDTIDLVINPP